MNCRMAAIDLDGTTFGKDLRIHRDNISSIKRAVEHGVIFTICSGRPYFSAIRVARSLGLEKENQYLICFNGASVSEAHTGKKIIGQPFEREYAGHVISAAKSNNVSVIAYIDGKPFSYREDEEVSAYYAHVGLPITIDERLEKRATGDFDKVLLRGAPSALKDIEVELADWAAGKAAFVYSDPKMLEYFNVNASKGGALVFLCKRLGIDMENVVAIGDYYNDITMLETAGIGCAVKASPPEVQAASCYVTERTAMEGAVSEVIERFVFGNK